MAIINNVAYSWSMIRISIPALDISEDSTIMQGVSEIKWNKTRKVENNYGIGGNAINRGFGNKPVQPPLQWIIIPFPNSEHWLVL